MLNCLIFSWISVLRFASASAFAEPLVEAFSEPFLPLLPFAGFVGVVVTDGIDSGFWEGSTFKI